MDYTNTSPTTIVKHTFTRPDHSNKGENDMTYYSIYLILITILMFLRFNAKIPLQNLIKF